jgi:MFS family permease
MALWGAGSALNVPIGIALAAADPVRGPAKVAAVTSLSSIANIVGPPAIGALGERIDIRLAMASIVAVILGAVAASGRAVRSLPRR